ncbi:MAG: PGPGW domain-containing protein [Melioribacteraceae bacterium]
MIFKSLKQLKRVVIGIIGTSILIIGIAMIVLPGPAFIVIPLGLSILATEFFWARKIMDKFKDKLKQLNKKK